MLLAPVWKKLSIQKLWGIWTLSQSFRVSPAKYEKVKNLEKSMVAMFIIRLYFFIALPLALSQKRRSFCASLTPLLLLY